MRHSSRLAWTTVVAAVVVVLTQPVAGEQVGGVLAGLVRSDSGIVQMGAEVDLMVPDGRTVKSVTSDYRGWFEFKDLPPGTYSIEVRQPNFSPARKPLLAVAPGVQTVLDVRMRGVFASLQLSYGSQISDMTERWRWVLRAKYSSRNVLRFAPRQTTDQEAFLNRLSGTFEDTQAYAQLSAGQGTRSNGLRSQHDLGSAFAVATSLFGNHDLTVSGNHGLGRTEMAGRSAAFRTTYAREIGQARPEVALTVRQMQATAVARRGVLDSAHGGQGVPHLQTLSLEFADAVSLTDRFRLEYGLLLESVKYVHRLHVASPYGKAVYSVAPGHEISFRYASGMPPVSAASAGQNAALRSNVQQLGIFPRVAMVGGRPTVQRSEHLDAGYRQTLGKTMIEAAVYQDSIRDAAVTASVPAGAFADGDLVPELYSDTATLNAGAFDTRGLRVSVARRLRDRLQAAIGYGYGGVLAPAGSDLQADTSGELRAALDTQRAHMVTASLSGRVPGAGTVMTGSYQWSSRQAVMPADPFNDFAARSAPGLNLVLRQPLPKTEGVPGRFEISADLRNLLKSGYVPLYLADGRILNLLQAIRSYSGTLSYVF